MNVITQLCSNTDGFGVSFLLMHYWPAMLQSFLDCRGKAFAVKAWVGGMIQYSVIRGRSRN